MELYLKTQYDIKTLHFKVLKTFVSFSSYLFLMCPSIFLKDKVLKQQKKNFYMYFINKGLEISEKDNVSNISREIQ